MAATRYRRFLRLCEEWPLDRTKKGRDLGTFLRQRVALVFREGESTKIADVEKCDQMYESLIRLNTNYYRTKYPRLTNTSFTGVTVEECQAVLATDSMKQMEEMKKGIWKKLRDKIAGKPEDVTKE